MRMRADGREGMAIKQTQRYRRSDAAVEDQVLDRLLARHAEGAMTSARASMRDSKPALADASIEKMRHGGRGPPAAPKPRFYLSERARHRGMHRP